MSCANKFCEMDRESGVCHACLSKSIDDEIKNVIKTDQSPLGRLAQVVIATAELIDNSFEENTNHVSTIAQFYISQKANELNRLDLLHRTARLNLQLSSTLIHVQELVECDAPSLNIRGMVKLFMSDSLD